MKQPHTRGFVNFAKEPPNTKNKSASRFKSGNANSAELKNQQNLANNAYSSFIREIMYR